MTDWNRTFLKEQQVCFKTLERMTLMDKFNRRALIRSASVSVGIAGLLSACASPTDSQTTGAASTAQAASTTIAQANIPTDPLVVLVSNPAKGELTVVRGDSEAKVTSHDLVQALLAL